MATIGLDNLVFAPITSAEDEDEEYGEIVKLAKAINADLSVEMNEATLFADDGVAEDVKEFKQGAISLGIDDIGSENAVKILGVKVDKNGAVVYAAENITAYGALGFRARKANGKYRYFWLYRTKFSVPSTSLQTKGDGITFSTPTLEGTFYRRNKAAADDTHPWKTEITEGEKSVNAGTVKNWFKEVYEPEFEGADSLSAAAAEPGAATKATASSKNTTAEVKDNG